MNLRLLDSDEGPFYISVASLSGACPPANWSSVNFNGASFVPPPASNPSVLSVAPPDIVARVQTLATVTISDLTVNLTSVPMNSTVTVPASNAQAVTVNQTWKIGNALASVVVLGGAPSLSDLGEASTSVDGVGTLTSLDQTATLDFPRIAVSFSISGSTAATITFTGRLLATSTLGCPSSCTSNGQCLPGATPAAPGTCLCDCGFSGGSCVSQSIPPLSVTSALVNPVGSSQVVLTGTGLGDHVLAAGNNVSVPPVQVLVGGLNCSSLTRLGANNASCNASSSPANSKLPVTASQGCQKTLRSVKTTVTLGTAPAPVATPAPSSVSGGLLDPSKCPQDLGPECTGYPATATANGTCDCRCKEGWAGQSCNICENDAACSLIGFTQCDRTNLYGANTTVKNYDCRITDPGLQNVVQQGVTLTVNLTSRDTTVAFRAADNSTTPVFCTALDCTVTPGTTEFACARTHCDCGNAAIPCRAGSTVQGLTAQVSGTAKFSCTGDAGTACTLIVDGFPVNIVATCVASECSNGGSIQALQAEGANWSVIGSTLGAVAAVMGVGILVGRWSRVKYRAKKEEQYLAWLAYKEQKVAAYAASQSAANGEEVPGDSEPDAGMAGESGFADPGLPPGRDLVVENLSVAKSAGESRMQKLGMSLLGGHRYFKLRHYLTGVDPSVYRAQIVSNVSLRLESGSMLAIMGPTGSGKTTLLNVLAGIGGGRTAGTTVYGRITVDGLARDDGYRYLAAYLPQEDFLYNTLTVQEAIRYAAHLRLPAYMPKRLKYEKVDEIIEYLGLMRVKGNRVGSSFGEPGLSGGERRRVRIAMELVSDPRIVLLDEPTSGLDSHTAARLVRLLHETARKGTIVVLSVHQPSQATFEEFDQVLLMSKRGRVVYFGPQRDIYGYFDRLGHPCVPERNFADHMLQVVSEAKEFDDPKWVAPHEMTRAASRKYSDAHGSAGIPSVEHVHPHHPSPPPSTSKKTRANAPPAPEPTPSSGIYRQSSLTPFFIENSLQQGLDQKHLSAVDSSKILSPIFASFARRKARASFVPEGKRTLRSSLTGPDFHRSMITELGVLYRREITNVVRNPALLGLHLTVSVCMGILVGAVFYDVKEDISGIQNRSGAFLFSLAFFSLASLSALEAFITERIIFTQEGSGKYYRTLSYYLPKITLDALFLRILPAVAYTCIMYWMMGLRPDTAKFLLFVVVIAMVAMVAGEVCSCISLLTTSVGVANIISIVVMLFMLLFGGALVNADRIVWWLKWLLKLSFVNYAYEILLTSQVEGLTIAFQPTNFPRPVPVKGEVFLTTLGLHNERRTEDTWALFAMVGGYLIVAWLLLMWRVSQATRLRVHKDRATQKPPLSPPPEEAPGTESAADV